MNNKKVMIIMAISFAVLAGTFSVNASLDNWTYLGNEGFYHINNGDEVIVYNLTQDKDKQKISDEIDKDPSNLEKWNKKRPDVIEPLKIKKLSQNNVLTNVMPETFSVLYEDKNEIKEVKLDKFRLNNETLLSISDPDFSGFSHQLVAASDNSRYLIASYEGLWIIDPENENVKKISKDSYNNKNIAQLQNELNERVNSGGDDVSPTLYWNENAIFSPDGSKLIYISNRDCTDTNGVSVWLYDVVTDDEKILVKSPGNEFYVPIGWIDNQRFIIKSITNQQSYQIGDLNGNIYNLELEGAYPEIVEMKNDLIAYTSDYTTANDIYIGKLDTNTNKLINIYNSSINGFMILNSVNICPNNTKLSFIYGTDNKGYRKLSIIDLVNRAELEINQNIIRGKLAGAFAKWIDNERILLHTDDYKNGLQEISSWIYNIKGGE